MGRVSLQHSPRCSDEFISQGDHYHVRVGSRFEMRQPLPLNDAGRCR